LHADGLPHQVRQHEPGLKGAYFGGRRMTGVRGDGLVRVQYATLYESTVSDAALVEWIKPFDDDHVWHLMASDCLPHQPFDDDHVWHLMASDCLPHQPFDDDHVWHLMASDGI